MTHIENSRRFGRRPPDHRARPQARFRLEGLEERCLLSGNPPITEFPLPSSGGSGSTLIAPGPDGNLWFGFLYGGYIGKINPATDAISEYSLPTTSDRIYALAAGPDGNVWFTDMRIGSSPATFIGMINPTTDAITEYTFSSSDIPLRGITAGPDGNLWFTDLTDGAIGMISPTTHAISEFTIPYAGAGPLAIAAGPDGNLWFTDGGTNAIGVINPATHAITEYAIPTAGSGVCAIAAGPDGNLWFTEHTTNKIGAINPTTHAITEFPTPTAGSLPYGITAGPDGNVWFAETGAGQIGKINPTTDAISEYAIPYASADPFGIAAGSDGNIWFNDHLNNAVGVVSLNFTQLVVTQQPPPSVTAGSPFGLTVQAESSSGSLDSSFDGTVTVALANNPGGATLGGTLTATASNGVATFFGLSLNKAASGYTLQLSASGLVAATTNAISVTPAAASQVVITAEPPTSVTAGSGFGLSASIEDAYGNVVTSDNAAVSVALANNPTGAALGGTLTVGASQGVAAFSGLTLTVAGSGYTLQASSSGLTGATSSAVTVVPAAATQVVITQQPPSSVVVNTGFGLKASIEDAYGNVVTSASNTVKVALANNPTGAKLGGTLSVKASKGVASFSGLTLNKVGTGYTLALSSSGLTGATTNSITVTSSGPDVVVRAASPIIGPDPLFAPLVFDSPDLWNGLGVKKRAR
jgi:streptogramin lyase